MRKIEQTPVKKMPKINPGDNLSSEILLALDRQKIKLKKTDILVVAHKIVSIAENRFVNLDNYKATHKAQRLSKKTGKSDKICQLILDNSTEILKISKGFVISRNLLGIVSANSGIDQSNIHEKNLALLLPKNPNRSAKNISLEIAKKISVSIPIVISDSIGRPWRQGLTQISVGSYGILPIKRYRKDMYHKILKDTIVPIVDELASSAGLLMEKDAGIPVVLIRGYNYDSSRLNAGTLLRRKSDDVFR